MWKKVNKHFYISVFRPADCAKTINLEDNGFLQTIFKHSVIRGNFFCWAGFGNIPSSHGDIPVVSFLMYEVENKTHIFRVLRFFYPIEAFSRLLQVSKMQAFCLYVLYDRILFWREHTVFIGFRWCSWVSFDFQIQFSIFSNSVAACNFPANTVPDNFQLVYFGSGKRMLISFELSYAITQRYNQLVGRVKWCMCLQVWHA